MQLVLDAATVECSIVVPPLALPSAGPRARREPRPRPRTGASEGDGGPHAIDPCQLVTQAEASAFTGETYGPGVESETPAI
jgi:hypothetical protein